MDSETTLQPGTLVRRAKELLFSQLDNEMLAVDAQAGYCYSLNETAGKIWGLLEQPTTLHDLCIQLRRAYSVDEATCLSDTVEILSKLHDAGLVELVNGTNETSV